MELRSLRYFVAIADEGSLVGASDVVRITQPALSRQLRALERELGIALFRRDHRRLDLTAAGREFLPVARDIVARAASAQRLAGDLRAGRLTRVTISAPTTTLSDVVAPFLTTFSPRDPVPRIVEADSAAALAALDEETDLAVVTQSPSRALGRLDVGVLPVWAYVPASHPWSARERVRLEELAESEVVVLDRGYRARQILDEALLKAGLATPDRVECSTPQVAQALAAAGRGIAIVSDDSRFGLHPLLIEGADGILTLRLVAAWRLDHHAAGTIEALARRLERYVRTQYDGARPSP